MVIASFCSFFLSLILSIAARTESGGFSVELIHRDSPKSPFYNPLETPSQRFANIVQRSISRAHLLSSQQTTETPRTNIISNLGTYLMNISLGTPPVPILAIADTGSDLVWTQCEPCSECYYQEAPFYNSSSSSTYKAIPCPSKQCEALERTSCIGESNLTCHYSIIYADQSFSNGDLAVDTITFGSTTGQQVAFPNIIFGCGQNNDGTFNQKGSGIVGLGAGNISLISQMEKSIGGKFSYCLVPLSAGLGSSSMINFGSNGIVSGPDVVSTPLEKKIYDTFYHLTLEAISINDERINFSDPRFFLEGNIIIDIGTPLTVLPSEMYSALVKTVSSKINATQVESPVRGLNLKPCYNVSKDDDLKVPKITAHFKGADVKLEPLNTFVQATKQVRCFAFTDQGNYPLYGNLAQMNFLVGYDIQKQTLSLKPTDCTKA